MSDSAFSESCVMGAQGGDVPGRALSLEAWDEFRGSLESERHAMSTTGSRSGACVAIPPPPWGRGPRASPLAAGGAV